MDEVEEWVKQQTLPVVEEELYNSERLELSERPPPIPGGASQVRYASPDAGFKVVHPELLQKLKKPFYLDDIPVSDTGWDNFGDGDGGPTD
jgi:hypothetical protein